MDTTLTPVYVYGFRPDELANWQRDYGLRPMELELDTLDILSEETPVVAHARAAAELTHKFESEGILSDIILYLPPGALPPSGAYYETAVGEAELPGLASTLGHPQQFYMQRLAEDVPLRLLAQPVQTLDLQSLGLPEADAAHLKTCLTCSSIFREALRERVRLYQRLNCPEAEELIEYASADPAPGRLAAHIRSCPFCNPQVEALRAVIVAGASPTPLARPTISQEEMAQAKVDDGRKVLMDVPAGTHLERGMSDRPSQPRPQLEELRKRLQAAFGSVFDLFDGARRGIGEWRIAGARGLKDHGRQDPGTDDEATFLPILQEVYDEGIPVMLSRGRESLFLGWDPEERLPYLELPGESAGRRREFSLEIRSAQTGKPVWWAMSQEGKLVVRPELVERQLRRHEARHGSRGTGNGDAEYHLVILEENSP